MLVFGCNSTKFCSKMSLKELKKERESISKKIGYMHEVITVWYVQQEQGRYKLKKDYGVSFFSTAHKTTNTPSEILEEEIKNIQKYMKKIKSLETLENDINKEIKKHCTTPPTPRR